MSTYQLEDNKKANLYFDQYNMLLDRSESNKHAMGDSLWWRSLALIAWPESGYEINHCVEIIKDEIYFYRHPLLKQQNTSRDQVLMLLVALRLNTPITCKIITRLMKRRIPNGARWTFDNWAWIKYLRGTGSANKAAFYMWVQNLAILANHVYRFFGGRTDRYLPYRFYNVHNSCWKYYTLPDCFWRRRLRKLLAMEVEKRNLLCRKLLGYKIDPDNYIPRRGWEWQYRKDKTINVGIYHPVMTPEQASQNVLIKDILYFDKN